MFRRSMLLCVALVAMAAVSARAETFSAEKIKQLRTQLAKLTEMPENTPEGWSKSRVNPNKLLDVFKPLSIRKGFVLRAYVFRERGNGNGVVWAMPVHADFPEPKDCPTLPNHLLTAPKPHDALDDAMEAIEGDGSAWSYLAASLLRREIAEFGAGWHGVSWGVHHVLDADPWKAPAGKPEDASLERPTSQPGQWKWLDGRPAGYAPAVVVEKDRVTVTFYTYSAIGKEGVYRHVDIYRPGKYRAKTEEKKIAEGPNEVAF